MPIQITTDQIATWCASHLLDYKHIPANRKVDLMPATKYNLLVTTFNSSTVLLVASVAALVLFAHAAATTFAILGLFTRFISDQELHTYTLPAGLDRGPGVLNALQTAFFRRMLHQTEPAEIKTNIFARLALVAPTNWHREEIIIGNFPVWLNQIETPKY